MKSIVTVGQGFCVTTAEFDPARMIGENFHYLAKNRPVFVPKEVDLGKAEYLSCLARGKESLISGTEKISRLIGDGHVSYGPDLAMGLLNDYQKDPEGCVLERIFESFGITHMFFMAGIIENDRQEQFIVYFCRSGEHYWKLLARLLSGQFAERCFAVAAPAP